MTERFIQKVSGGLNLINRKAPDILGYWRQYFTPNNHRVFFFCPNPCLEKKGMFLMTIHPACTHQARNRKRALREPLASSKLEDSRHNTGLEYRAHLQAAVEALQI